MDEIPPLIKGNIVKIIWQDSSSLPSGWAYPPFTLEIGTIKSAGVVVKTTPGQVTITTCLNDEGAAMTPIAIPFKAIKELKKLE